MSNICVLHLGSNVGNRKNLLAQAIMQINESLGLINSISNIFETAPWGIVEQNNFLNLALILETEFTVTEALIKIGQIEKKMGRVREMKWGPRMIDIDIIFYNDEIINTDSLQVPHPHMHERNFVLAPLNDIMPDYVHPILKLSVKDLLSISKDLTSYSIYEDE